MRDAAIILLAAGLIALLGWRFTTAVERLGQRGRDKQAALDAGIAAERRDANRESRITTDPVDEHFSQTPVYESHRAPACAEHWDDEVGCSWPGLAHRCTTRGAHSTHRCPCGSLVVEAAPTLREQMIGAYEGAGVDRLPGAGYIVGEHEGCTCPWNNGYHLGNPLGHHVSCPSLAGQHHPDDDCPRSGPLRLVGVGHTDVLEPEAWVTVGQHRVHIACRDKRRDGQPVTDPCARWLSVPAPPASRGPQ